MSKYYKNATIYLKNIIDTLMLIWRLIINDLTIAFTEPRIIHRLYKKKILNKCFFVEEKGVYLKRIPNLFRKFLNF